MPIFEFTCEKCGHRFEELVSLSELEEGKLGCPACGSRKIEKGFSAFATGGASGLPGAGCGTGGFT